MSYSVKVQAAAAHSQEISPMRPHHHTSSSPRDPRWSYFLLGTLLLAACSQDPAAVTVGLDASSLDADATDPSCDPSRYLLGPVQQRHGASEAPEWIDRGIDFARPDGRAIATQYWLPWDVNDLQVYAVESGASMFLRLRSMLGSEWPSVVPARLLAFVDSKPARVTLGLATATHLDFQIHDGLDDRVIELAKDQLHTGLNTVQFYVHYGQQPFDPLRTTFALSVAVGEPTIQEESDSDLKGGTAFEPGYLTRAWWTHPSVGQLPFYLLDFLPFDGTEFPVRLTLQAQPRTLLCSDPSAYDKFAIVALLDGVSFPLGAQEHLVATLKDGEEREYTFNLRLPKDGLQHEFIILQLSGLGRPARLTGGRGLPNWVPPPGVVSYVQWQ